MKAHIPDRSPLTENRLSPEQVDMYLMLSVLREKHGFGKKRLALFLGGFAANKEQYNKLRYTKGKKHADLELRKATINCYEAVTKIMQEHTGKPFTAGKLTEVQAKALKAFGVTAIWRYAGCAASWRAKYDAGELPPGSFADLADDETLSIDDIIAEEE